MKSPAVYLLGKKLEQNTTKTVSATCRALLLNNCVLSQANTLWLPGPTYESVAITIAVKNGNAEMAKIPNKRLLLFLSLNNSINTSSLHVTMPNFLPKQIICRLGFVNNILHFNIIIGQETYHITVIFLFTYSYNRIFNNFDTAKTFNSFLKNVISRHELYHTYIAQV